MKDQYSKVENEGYKKAQTIKLMEIERHQQELRIVELAEAVKSERQVNERNLESIGREKEA
jgi:hypothetical protein